MKKILFISTRFPFPVLGGDKLRSFDILEFLSKKNQVDLVCLGEKNKILKKKSYFLQKHKSFPFRFFI